MSVGAWEPNNQASANTADKPIDHALLMRIVETMSSGTEQLDNLDTEITAANWLSGLAATQWLKEAENWSDEQIWMLIRFFTLAEMQLSDWQGGAESAVIPLAKALRQRKAPLSREQLLWIRQHSDNRYLPYGPL
ncbi:hypothetical protein [Microbulbifer sp.]|uniref:hypothetical protein n=1 Tax=Microbulbifer sp. TaxID=1908541 RepID=UPI00258DF226|nr:hypothetical protein [Microbulbifer sp.]